MSAPMDVRQGTLDLLILRALERAPTHGWGIGERIAEMSGGAFQVGQGSLYPALHRFEGRGWVLSYWRTTENSRIARVYELSPQGMRALDEEIASWRQYTGAIDRVIGAR